MQGGTRFAALAQVSYWHEADMLFALPDVCVGSKDKRLTPKRFLS
jgi:hypothetical protein